MTTFREKIMKFPPKQTIDLDDEKVSNSLDDLNFKLQSIRNGLITLLSNYEEDVIDKVEIYDNNLVDDKFTFKSIRLNLFYNNLETSKKQRKSAFKLSNASFTISLEDDVEMEVNNTIQEIENLILSKPYFKFGLFFEIDIPTDISGFDYITEESTFKTVILEQYFLCREWAVVINERKKIDDTNKYSLCCGEIKFVYTETTPLFKNVKTSCDETLLEENNFAILQKENTTICGDKEALYEYLIEMKGENETDWISLPPTVDTYFKDDEECLDVGMYSDVSIKDFYNEDNYNRVIFKDEDSGKSYCFPRLKLIELLNNKDQTYFECTHKSPGGYPILNPDTKYEADSPELIKVAVDVVYLFDYFKFHDAILSKNIYFKINKIRKSSPLYSLSVFMQEEGSAVSGAHCQDGTEENVYNIVPVNIESKDKVSQSSISVFDTFYKIGQIQYNLYKISQNKYHIIPHILNKGVNSIIAEFLSSREDKFTMNKALYDDNYKNVISVTRQKLVRDNIVKDYKRKIKPDSPTEIEEFITKMYNFMQDESIKENTDKIIDKYSEKFKDEDYIIPDIMDDFLNEDSEYYRIYKEKLVHMFDLEKYVDKKFINNNQYKNIEVNLIVYLCCHYMFQMSQEDQNEFPFTSLLELFNATEISEQQLLILKDLIKYNNVNVKINNRVIEILDKVKEKIIDNEEIVMDNINDVPIEKEYLIELYELVKGYPTFNLENEYENSENERISQYIEFFMDVEKCFFKIRNDQSESINIIKSEVKKLIKFIKEEEEEYSRIYLYDYMTFTDKINELLEYGYIGIFSDINLRDIYDLPEKRDDDEFEERFE
jgi:hypothetical protein